MTFEFVEENVAGEAYDEYLRLEALKLAVRMKLATLETGRPFAGTLKVADVYLHYIKTGENSEAT